MVEQRRAVAQRHRACLARAFGHQIDHAVGPFEQQAAACTGVLDRDREQTLEQLVGLQRLRDGPRSLDDRRQIQVFWLHALHGTGERSGYRAEQIGVPIEQLSHLGPAPQAS